MTDERPAEPDTADLRRMVVEYGDARVVKGLWRAEMAADIEAAARVLAIEYAESRVRAMPCTGSVFERGVSNYVSGRCDVVQKDYPEAIPCAVHTELAALARLKEAIPGGRHMLDD